MRESPEGGAILEALSRIRAWVYGDPLLLMLGLWVVVGTSARRSLSARPSTTTFDRLPRSFWPVPLVAYLLIAAWYFRTPTYFDHIEASVAAISWNMARGYPLYPGSADPFQYALPYGPALYGANALMLSLAGPGLAASKVAGIGAALASLAIVAYALRRRVRPFTSAGMLALAYLAFGPMSLWTRAEPLLLLVLAGAVACSGLGRSTAAVTTGVLLAAAVLVKVTGFSYVLPLIVLLHRRHGIAWTASVLVISSVLVAAPFFAEPVVSWPHYLQVLGWTERHGIRWASLSTTVQWAVVIVSPALVTALRGGTAQPGLGAARWTLLLAALAMVPLSAKYGAGPYHLLPFVPVALFLAAPSADEAALRAGRLAPARLAFIAGLVAIAVVQQAYWIAGVGSRPLGAIDAELQYLLKANGRSTAVGYSSNYQGAMLRPLAVFGGSPYVLDAPALMDRQFSGVDFPAGALRIVESCTINTWLMPSGGEPFALPNAYDARRQVFPPEFVETFRANYRLVERRAFFDVWRCKTEARR